MKENLVSIIVPVYNSEKWIERCVDSVIAQTYSDWQLILIDDGSLDNTPEILDEIKEKDDRIVVFHIKNGGVANARNVALLAAEGEFVTFCDGDDYYEPTFIETLLSFYRETKADLCISSVYVEYCEKTTVSSVPLLGFYKDKDISKILHTFFKIYFQGLWNKLFLNRVIRENKIEFNSQLSLAEDSIFILDYISCINSVYCEDTPIYHYVQDNSSSLSKSCNREIIKANNMLVNKLLAVAKKYNCDTPALHKYCRKFYLSSVCDKIYYCMLLSNCEEKRKVFKKFKENKEAVELACKSSHLSIRMLGKCPYFINTIYFFLYKKIKNK